MNSKIFKGEIFGCEKKYNAPSFEIPADIFTHLSVFDSPKVASKYQPVFQKKACNNIHIIIYILFIWCPINSIDQSPARHKLEYDSGFPISKLLSITRVTRDMAESLQSLCYKASSIS